MSLLDPSNFPQTLQNEASTIEVKLQYTALDITHASQFIRSPSCGANVLFLGTTRDNFNNRPVSRLSYQAYPALALRTLLNIASEVSSKHGLERVAIVHRLGEVPVGEESIVVGVSSGHRGKCWRGAEEVLERVKERAEIWKREWFVNVTAGGDGEEEWVAKEKAEKEEGVWKANKDTDADGRVIG